MPTYEYQCHECQHRFEHAQNMSAPALQECPECNGRLERLIGGGVGIIVKGGNKGFGNFPDCGSQGCGMEPSDGACCGGGGSGEPPPCMR